MTGTLNNLIPQELSDPGLALTSHTITHLEHVHLLDHLIIYPEALPGGKATSQYISHAQLSASLLGENWVPSSEHQAWCTMPTALGCDMMALPLS